MAKGKIPIAFIVDDAPVNATYFIRAQMSERNMLGSSRRRSSFSQWLDRWPEMEKGKIVPNEFWRNFIEWAKGAGVRGKFTFLPCPAGLGYVDERVEGYTDRALAELVALVRDDYPPNFDITPEIFTHSLAWDIEKRELLPTTEWEWTYSQDEAALTHYMAEALRVLLNVGIRATGITQPCNFSGDEHLYARAVLAALKEVNGISHTYYFLHADGTSPRVPCPIMIQDGENGDCVVSVTSGSKADEPFWASIYGDGDVQEMAGYFISEDGNSGRLVDLCRAGGPVIFHGHAQTLYSSGTERGFEALREVVKRVNEHLSDAARWMNMTQLVEHTIARAEEDA